jgi:hypothetical protein
MLRVDYDRLLSWLLPPFLRKAVMLSWLTVLITPIKSLYVSFVAYADFANYKLRGTGQVCSMQRVLNDRFDSTLRRIRIKDGDRFTRQFIFTSAEDNPVYLGTVYIHDKDDYIDSGVDFTVVLPPDVFTGLNANTLSEMKANINFYKLDGKRYKIISA